MEYRAGMFVYALAFLLGVVFVQQLAVLPTLSQMLGMVCGYAVIVFFTAVLFRKHLLKKHLHGPYFLRKYPFLIKYITLIISCILLFIIGVMYSSFYSNQHLSHYLDEDLVGKSLMLTGTVSGVPVDDGKVQRFEFYVDQLSIIDSNNDVDGISAQPFTSFPEFPKKIRLSWYYGTSTISAGDQWKLEVRLKPPHGFLNPGGFDYEGWLFQHGIQATGYVRKSALNQKQDISSDESLPEQLLSSLSKLRQEFGEQIDAAALKIAEQREVGDESESFSLIKALAIGDKSAISKQQWQVLSATGTSHLMAISGLHIGLAAWFAYILIRRIVPSRVIKAIPAQHVALTGSLFVAMLYALIAGLSVPTQRAFIMLLILSLMVLIRRNHRPVDALGFAMIVVLMLDPLAVLSAGFWFSFSAVAVIFISLNSSSAELLKHSEVTQTKNRVTEIALKFIFILKKWIRLQLLISLFLLPLSLFMFQQVSLISPVANLLLIPYVSFLVVPLVLLALCLTFILPELAAYLFYIAAGLLDLVWPVLTYFSAQPYALWVQGDVGMVQLLLATSSLCLIYFSKSLRNVFSVKGYSGHVGLFVGKYVGKKSYLLVLIVSLVLLMLLLWLFLWAILHGNNSPLSSGEYSVTLLDVGQGSASVVETQNHVVVFDTGAKFSEKLDIGDSVIIPYLRSQGIRSIDRLIISHGDADHIGGASAVLEVYPKTAVLGQDIVDLKSSNKRLCIAGNKWQWDGVDFEFLSPMASGRQVPNQHPVSIVKRNNKSCVLKVSSPMGSTLFTGDIEKTVERQLLSNSETQLKSDVLIIPHHGSKTSSSQDFINAVSPKIAILSVGYKNRYKLPNQQVISRYQASGSQIMRTDKDGAITIQFIKNKIQTKRYRELEKRYWHHSIE